MKTTLTIIAAFAVCSVLGQKKITVQSKSDNLGGGNHPALSVMIYEGDKGDIEKAWKSELKKMGAKVSMKSEIFGDDAHWKVIGDNTFDVYAKVRKVGDEGVELTVAVDLGGTFMTQGQHSSQWKAFEKLIYDFAVKATKDAIGNQVKIAEGALADIIKEQEKLVKENEKRHKDIEDYNETIKKMEDEIKKAEEDIKNNEKNQEAKKKEIETQTKVVEDIKGKLEAVK